MLTLAGNGEGIKILLFDFEKKRGSDDLGTVSEESLCLRSLSRSTSSETQREIPVAKTWSATNGEQYQESRPKPDRRAVESSSRMGLRPTEFMQHSVTSNMSRGWYTTNRIGQEYRSE